MLRFIFLRYKFCTLVLSNSSANGNPWSFFLKIILSLLLSFFSKFYSANTTNKAYAETTVTQHQTFQDFYILSDRYRNRINFPATSHFCLESKLLLAISNFSFKLKILLVQATFFFLASSLLYLFLNIHRPSPVCIPFVYFHLITLTFLFTCFVCLSGFVPIRDETKK